MFNWLRSRFQIQRVEMDHDLLTIIEHWPKLNRQQRDRVKLLIVQGARTSDNRPQDEENDETEAMLQKK